MPRFLDQIEGDSEGDDTRHIPRADQGSFNFTPSQAATTVYAESMAETSLDAHTRVSTYTYASGRDAERFLKKVDNRSFNVLSEIYYLPTDDEEWSRLDKQHVAVVVGLGGLYPERETVQAILAPEEGVTKNILDLGCGTGVWAVAMANEFPHAKVVGLDAAPVPIEVESLPSNVRFELDDINLGLPHFKDTFDIIHLRLVATGLRNFRKTMSDVNSCLKPGGMVIWVDADYQMYSRDQHIALPYASDENPSGSWTSRFFYEIQRAAVKAARSDLYGMAEALDAGLWDDPLMDPNTCRTASLYNPIGPWAEGASIHETQQLKYIGALVRQDMMGAQQTVNALLKKAGWRQEELDGWCSRVNEEMMGNKAHMWGRMRLAWGRRRVGPGQSAPPLPAMALQTFDQSDGSEELPASASPYLYIYKTKEEADRETEIRNLSQDFPQVPEPSV